MNRNRKISGFTFIEVLIAIAVFSIGVLAILNLVMRNLDTIDKVQHKTSATLLAKEGIEIAYNVRNSNNIKWFAWDCVLKDADEIAALSLENAENVCASYFSDWVNWNVFQVSFDPDRYHFIQSVPVESSMEEDEFMQLFETHKLYYYTGESNNQSLAWYGYANDELEGEATSFARYLVFTWIQDDTTTLPTENILKIESHVLIQRWSYQKDIMLESFISSF